MSAADLRRHQRAVRHGPQTSGIVSACIAAATVSWLNVNLMSALGRKRTLISRSHQQFERPLSGKAVIREVGRLDSGSYKRNF